jgi:hypothetical protein
MNYQDANLNHPGSMRILKDNNLDYEYMMSQNCSTSVHRISLNEYCQSPELSLLGHRL